MNDNKNRNSNDFASWLLIVILFFTVWPLGLLMLLSKLGVFTRISQSLNPSARQASTLDTRMDTYRRCMSGRSSVPLQELAGAAGVSYETALREIQYMLKQGSLPPAAYINYMTKTLILRSAQSSGQTPVYTQQAARPQAGVSASAAATASAAPVSAPRKDVDRFGISPALSTALLALGILLVGTGAITFWTWISSFVDFLSGYGFFEISSLVASCLLCGGGLLSLRARSRMKKRALRIRSYLALITNRDSVSLAVLAEAAGVSEAVAKRDIEAMLEKGLLGENAFFNAGTGILVLRPDAFARREKEKAEEAHEDDDSDDVYVNILREIREVNDAIPDPAVSERIDKIEEITSKIFDAVREKPEKLPQIKSFMSYYLPTTLKLLRSYSTFDKQGIDGENIGDAKKNIERVLDSLVDGFSKQLDQLYRADAIDISTDINVLESMLKKDGLSDDGSAFQTAVR